jgi:hypothetical protein
MLYIAMTESDRFSLYMRETIRRRGEPSLDKPWSIALYADEVTCGNPLAVKADNRRKAMGVYWTVFQLGAQALSDESCWFELVAFRTKITSTFIGSISHLLDVCLSCFFDPEGHDIRMGLDMPLKSHGRINMVLGLEMLIADIMALVPAIGAMGVHAVVPCFFAGRC